MIDQKLNKKRLEMHWHYYRVRYIILLIVALVAANILLTTTEPKTPPNQKVDVYIISAGYVNSSIDPWQKSLLSILPADQKEVNLISTLIVEGQESSIYQMVAARMAAQEGTVWILPVDMFQSYARSGAFLPLEEDIGTFNLPEDFNLSTGRAVVQMDDNTPGKMQLCGIPLEKCTGLSWLMDYKGMVLAFPAYSTVNYENAKTIAKYLVSQTGSFSEPPAQMDTGIGFFIASAEFASTDTGEWEKAVQDALKPEPAFGVSLVPFAPGREALVAEALAERAKNFPAGVSIVPKGVFSELVKMGALAPLDEVAGSLNLPEDTDLSVGRGTPEKNGKPVGTEQLYGIPVDAFRGFHTVFNPADMMLVFPAQEGDSLKLSIEAANLVLERAEGGN